MRRCLPLQVVSTLAALASVLAASPATAAIVPASEEFVVGEADYLSASRFLAWTGRRFAVIHGQSGLPPGKVSVRFIEPFSNMASEPVELAEAGTDASVAAFDDGSIVAVWQDAAGWQGRFVDASGTVLSAEFPLGELGNYDVRPAAGSEGRWVVTYSSYASETGISTIHAVRFQDAVRLDADPVEVAEAETAVASGVPRSDVAMLPSGSFVASWIETLAQEPEEYEEFPTTTHVNVRGFLPDGTAGGDGQMVGAGTHEDEQGFYGHALATDGSDEFAIAWVDDVRSDYDAPATLLLQMLGGTGHDLDETRVLGNFDEEAYGVSLAVSEESAVVAVGLEADEFQVRLYEIGRELDEVSQWSSVDGAAIEHEGEPMVAMSGGRAGLVVWSRSTTHPVTQLVARAFVAGTSLPCGDATYNGALSAADALAVLRTAVGLRYCAASLCDTDGSGGVSASDAALVLYLSIGLPVIPVCPPQE